MASEAEAEVEAESMSAAEFSKSAKASEHQRRRLSIIRAPEDLPPVPPVAAAEPSRSPSNATPADDTFLDEFKRCLLVTGWPLRKLSSKGVLASRVMKLNPRLDTLTWPTRAIFTGSTHKIAIADISAVSIGSWSSDAALPADPKEKAACISIECSSDVAHDFMLLDDLDAMSFATGLRLLMAQATQEHAEANDDAAVAFFSNIEEGTATARGELHGGGAVAAQDADFVDRFLGVLNVSGWPLLKLSHKNVLARRVIRLHNNSTLIWPSAKVIVGSHESGVKIGHSVKLIDIISVKVGVWGGDAELPVDAKEREKCVCIEARHENYIALGSEVVHVTHNFMCLDALDAVTFAQGIYALMQLTDDSQEDDSAIEDAGGGRARVKTISQAEGDVSDEIFLDEFKGVMATSGWPMLKRTHKGDLLRRVLKLNRAMDTLHWPSRRLLNHLQTSHSIPIESIGSVSVGQWGPEPDEISKCIRVVDLSGNQIFDFMALDEVDALAFSQGLKLFLAEMANNESVDHNADEVAASNAALAEYRAEEVSPEEFTDKFKGVLLTSGWPVMRLTNKCKMVSRLTKLNKKQDMLFWPTKKVEGRVLGNSHSVTIANIKEVRIGPWPAGLLPMDGRTIFTHLCLTIVNDEGSATCLEFDNEIDIATFKAGVEAIGVELATEDACHAEDFEAAQSAMPVIEADDESMFDHFKGVLMSSGWPVQTLTSKGKLVRRVIKLKDGVLYWPTHKPLGHSHTIPVGEILASNFGTWNNFLWELPDAAAERAKCLFIETHDSMYNIKLINDIDVLVWRTGMKKLVEEMRSN